jgi:cytochrome b561
MKPERQLRIIQIAFIVASLMIIDVSRKIQPPAQNVNSSLQWAIVFIAIGVTLSGFLVQRLMLRAQSQSLPAAHNHTRRDWWFKGHIIRFAFAQAVVLFGFFLHTIGSKSILVIALYVSGILLLLIRWPGTSPPNN